MAYDAGNAYLSITPSFLNVEELIAKGARDIAKHLDKSLGKSLGQAMQGASQQAQRDTDRAGQALGKTFADGMVKRVRAGLANLPEGDRILAPLRKELESLSQIDLGKGFNEKDFIQRVERAYDALRKAQQDAQGANAVGRFTNAGNAAAELGSVKDIVEAARKRGFMAGDAYSDAYQARLKAMDKALPDTLIRQGTTGEQRDLGAIKSRVQDAQKVKIGDVASSDNNPLNLKIGTKVDGEALKRNLGYIEGLLDHFSERAGTVELVVASDKARQQAAAFYEDTKTLAEKAAEDAAREQQKADEQNAKLRGQQTRRELEERAKQLKADRESEAREQQKADEQNAKLRGQQIRREFEDRSRELKAERDAEFRDLQQAAAERLTVARKEVQEREQIAERNRQLNLQRDRKEIEDRAKSLAQARAQELADQRRLADEIVRERTRAYAQTSTGEAQSRLGGAADRIVDVPVHLQASSVDREMAAIRARVKALGDVEIGVDMDTKQFGDQVNEEFRKLEAIAHDKKVTIDVRVDAARAATELGGILVLLNRIDHDRAEVKVDADSAAASLQELASSLSLSLGRLGGLIAVGASIGSALVPAAAAAASAVGAIGTAALAAGSGVGVLLLAFSGIGSAIQALSQYSDSQRKSNVSLAKSGNQVAAANEQIQSAEMALANTRRNNKNAAVKAAQAVKNAIVDQGVAVRDVAQANQDAVEKATTAQHDATQAALDDLRARASLTEAYRAAQRALEDLSSTIIGNGLDQRQATLDIAKAKEDLDKLLANPRATVAEREQADITYKQRLLQMDDLKRQGQRLADEQDKQFQQGIDKSDEVVKAKQDIIAADERNRKAQLELAKDQKAILTTQVDGVQKLQKAQQKVDDARSAAADQRKDAAYAEFTATQSLISARRALTNASNSASVAGGAQLDNLRTAMSKLTPTAQLFAKYIFSLQDAFFALRAAADPVIAGVQKAMESLLGTSSSDAEQKLKPLFSFVNRVATALGGIFVQFADTLKGPTFTKFFDYLSKTAVPMLQLMADAFTNILVGVVNLFLAFTPLTDQVSGGFLDMTKRFRDWSDGLSKNEGFQKFLDYMKKSGPKVMHLLGQVAQAIGDLVIAAAPVGSKVIDLFTQLFEWINKIPEKTLISLVTGITAAATAIGLFAAATAIATLGAAGLISLGIAALVVAFSALVGSNDTLRAKLVTAWDAIKGAAVVAFGFVKKIISGLKPVFDDMVSAALSFYNDGLKPAFDDVAALGVSLYKALEPSFSSIGGIFQKIGGIAFFLYDQAILPAFKGIMAVTKVLLEVLKPVFEVIGTVIGALATIVFWLLDHVFLPVIGGIVVLLVKVLGPVFKFLWKFILEPILKSIGLAFQIVAAIIKVAIGLVLIILKSLGWVFKSIWEDWIKPAWEHGIKPVFDKFVNWLEDSGIIKKFKDGFARLGKIWKDFGRLIRTPIKFIVETLLNDGLLKGYNWLADKFNIEPKNVHIDAPKGGWDALYASGGAVRGAGTGTSDSIRARLSNGEHVLTAREVAAAGGHQAIYEWRRQMLRGRGFARGGAVEIGDGFGDWLKKTAKSIGSKASDVFDSAVSFVKNPLGSLTKLAQGLFGKIPGKDTWIVQKLISIPGKILDSLKSKVKGLFGGQADKAQDGTTSSGIFGSNNALGGTGGMMQILRGIFPGLALNSGYRPGAITVSGNPSYHGLNRAVDVPPRRDVFEWIRKNYPNSRELIFSPMGAEQIKDGRSHVYSGAVKAIHYNHLHWAYDKGGLLPDTRRMPGGVMQMFHGRRTPDKVLTDTQWQSMAQLAGKARESMSGGDTYNFPYRDSTLTIDELNNWSARRDALNRVNRVNY